MNSRWRQIAFALMIVASFVPTSVAGQSRSANDGSITQFVDDFLRAMTSGDAKRLAAMFADDATVFYPSLPFAKRRASGRSDIETAWQQGLAAAGATPRVEPKRTQIQTYGDIAIVTFELDANPPRVGRRTFVLQRNSETWKILHLHASNRTE